MANANILSQESSNHANRIFWIDLLRASAAFMVVILHAGSPYLTRYGRFPEWQWVSVLVVESWLQVSVPLFFMISGFLFLRKEQPSLIRPLVRAVAPLAAYSVIASIYLAYFKGTSFSETWGKFIYGKPFYHLWFFYTLIGVYICFYVMRPRTAGWRPALVTLGAMITLGIGAGRILSEFTGVSSRIFFDGTFVIYLLYGFLGYYLATAPEISRRTFWCLCLGVAILAAIISGLTYWVAQARQAYSPIFLLYQSPFVIAASAATFLVLKAIGPTLAKIEGARAMVSFTARYSLGIYGLHAFVLDYLRFYTPLGLISQHVILHVIYMTALTIAISLILARGLAEFDRWGLVVTSSPPVPVWRRVVGR